MSPALIESKSQLDLQLQTLARAFEALLLTTQQLSCKERTLQQRLKHASEEYIKLAEKLPGGLDGHTKIVSEKIAGRSAEYDYQFKQQLNPPDVVKSLAESGNVGDVALASIREGLACYQSIIPPQDAKQLPDLDSCLVATRAGLPPTLEKDFTTKGTQGSLRCPFAKPNNKPPENGVTNGVELASQDINEDTCGHADLDPIKAEQNDRRSSRAPSTRSSNTRCPVSRCPIRYLDQHSPEEIADYVERHKHEIPRSHAICVQRYQRDSQTMRHLDAKYGNLISMIQGLSVKHRAFLPGTTQNGAPPSSSSAERVEKWAEEVGLKSDMHPPPIKEEEGEGEIEQEDEERKGHFDRPLREVRVGESPSRPWGIPVPITPMPPTASAPQSPAAPVAASLDPTSNSTSPTPAVVISSNLPMSDSPPEHHAAPPKTGRCPFGHGAPSGNKETKPPAVPQQAKTIKNHEKSNHTEDPAKEDREEAHDAANPTQQPAVNSVVFNGPVFFGFSAEQTALVLQQLGKLGNYG
ncbi:uncharacterized protein BO97DRAFT_408198 [Aspergillus homomorphus CBS 101889]|uniref:Uncharacterized protein n=1 Tax=Aspergillus homomorphus (strain CBS 101889) TaxID=1450537 RepID=A0A395HLM8_ASPHC|nr:hypothetical protein BO97DRAFT_408198 [Aspergillus homomorphus CBS 101889]RAL08670.1 hypothetical protein BO97DRAFT_408198 [Aspergillus homomorphus CBS 101889]